MEALHRHRLRHVPRSKASVSTTWETTRTSEQPYSARRNLNLPQVLVPTVALLEVSFLLMN
jgi:hypothetical protein